MAVKGFGDFAAGVGVVALGLEAPDGLSVLLLRPDGLRVTLEALLIGRSRASLPPNFAIKALRTSPAAPPPLFFSPPKRDSVGAYSFNSFLIKDIMHLVFQLINVLLYGIQYPCSMRSGASYQYLWRELVAFV